MKNSTKSARPAVRAFTRVAAMFLVALTLFSLVAIAAPTADAATTYTYYPRYTGTSGSIVTALKAVGVDSSYANRKNIAAVNGISGYSGTAAQNTKMLQLLKNGKLIKSVVTTPDPVQVTVPVYYPRYTGTSGSIVTGLNAVGVNSSFTNRKNIAAVNGITGYTGTAAQNTKMLNMLKAGTLVKEYRTQTVNGGTTGTLVNANLSKVTYIQQKPSSCKATSMAMALNVIYGYNKYGTNDMTTSPDSYYAKSINGNSYTGSNGVTYVATYKTDSYVGSRSALITEIEKALAAGVPIVVPVHSTKSGGTKHHWVVLVGKSGNDYLIVNPSGGNTSMSMADNVKTMSQSSLDFGLTDYSSTHYGFITFAKK